MNNQITELKGTTKKLYERIHVLENIQNAIRSHEPSVQQEVDCD